MASSLRPKFSSPDKKLDLLAQFEQKANQSKLAMKTWNQHKNNFKTSKSRQNFTTLWSDSFRKLNEQQKSLEESLQNSLILLGGGGVGESEQLQCEHEVIREDESIKFVGENLRKLNSNLKNRGELELIIEDAKLGDRSSLKELEIHWIGLEKEMGSVIPQNFH